MEIGEFVEDVKQTEPTLPTKEGLEQARAEFKKLTEKQPSDDLVQTVNEITQDNEDKSNEQQDNLVLAERILTQLLPPFFDSLDKLSNKQLRRLIKLLVQFPFVDPQKFKLTQEQKVAFMYGERLIYANMVKRARAELDRTFGEVQEEIKNKEKTDEIKQGE